MSHKRHVWETFCQLAQRLLSATDANQVALPAEQSDTAQELKRLGKTQFKANTLQETALNQLRQAMEQLTTQGSASDSEAQHDLLAALLPVLDGLEAAIESGERLLSSAPDEQTAWVERQLPGQQDKREAARLALQSDRVLMTAWLDGLRLVQGRLLTLLTKGGVKPISSVGQPFDPYLHQAVGTSNHGAHPAGTVVVEQRRGYTSPAGVLRYAEVIVNRQVEKDKSDE